MNRLRANSDKRHDPAADRHSHQPHPGVSAETAGGVGGSRRRWPPAAAAGGCRLTIPPRKMPTRVCYPFPPGSLPSGHLLFS
jgi:hypothetical protein